MLTLLVHDCILKFLNSNNKRDAMNQSSEITKVAIVQDSPVFLDKDATIKKAISLIQKASKEGVKLILFPEAFLSGYPDWIWTLQPSNKKVMSTMFSALYNSAISADDDSLEPLYKAAQENSIYVIMGANEKNSEASNGTIYNSMVYISNKGALLGIHRKLIPTISERMMWGQGDGNSLHSFDTPFGKIGGLLCWENYMPLARNVMYEAGV